jgi:hypothetical protein
MELAKTRGVELIELSAEEAARWQKAAEPAIEAYVKEMLGIGL